MVKLKNIGKRILKKNSEIMKNINTGKAFYDNKFVIIFSLFLSFSIWLWTSTNNSQTVSKIISDIPIDVQLSESAKNDGLRIFGGKDVTARVEITGNRIVVGQVTKDDIQVTAPQAASTIISPGNYTLELSAKKVGMLQDYDIVSDIHPSVITVVVDRYREAEFDVESDISFTAKSGYYVGNTVLSSPKVTLSGPETEISKIKKVMINDALSGESDSTIKLKLPIIMYDAYNRPIYSETISSNVSEIEATIPILMQKEVSLLPTFSNLPSGIEQNKFYNFVVSVSPPKINIAGSDEEISSIEKIDLEQIDFNNVGMNNNKFTLPINLPQNCKTLDNIYSADVLIDMSYFREKNLVINNFVFENVPSNKEVSVYNKEICITALFPYNKSSYVKPTDIVAQLDFADIDINNSNSIEVPVKLKVLNHNDVWIFGKYFVNVNVKNK